MTSDEIIEQINDFCEFMCDELTGAMFNRAISHIKSQQAEIEILKKEIRRLTFSSIPTDNEGKITTVAPHIIGAPQNLRFYDESI